MRQGQRRKTRWIWFAAALLAGALVWFAQPFFLGTLVDIARVARGDLVRTVVASGHVETPHRVEIGSQITGVVAAVPVQEGDAVRHGQLLIALDDAEARSLQTQASAAVSQASARLRQIREVTLPMAEQALRQSEANLRNARQQFERIDRLHTDGFATQVQFEETRRALDVAEAQARSARLQVESARSGGSETVLAETALEQARANLVAAATRLDYTRIRAPADGRVLTRIAQPGTIVQPGRVLMVLSPAGDIELVLQIDERNLALLAVGQPALASADAYPDRRFAATLRFIDPAVNLQRGSVEVKLRVDDPPDYLREDMTVSVDIAVARRPAALHLPTAAVRGGGAGAQPTWVYRVEQGRAVRRDVAIGLQAGGRVEILDGLAEGDLVIVGAPANLADGRKVRARPGA